MPVLISDSFNRANNAALGFADTGQLWNIMVGSGWNITSNKANATDTVGGPNIVYQETGFSDGVVSADLTYGSVSGDSMGICFRQTDSNNYWVARLVNNNLDITKYVAGSSTFITDMGGYTLVAGTTYNVKVVMSGPNIAVYLNGSFVYSIVDNFNQFATKHGFRINPSNGSFDNFKFETPAESTVLVSDQFTRTSTTTLGKTDTGQFWIPVSGTWGTISNEAYSVSDADFNRAVLPSLGTSDYIVSANIKGTFGSATYRLPEITVRYVDSANMLTVYLYNGSVRITKRVASVLTDLANVATTTTDGTYYNLRVSCIGSNIQVFVDGVSKINYTLTSAEYSLFGTSGVVGMVMEKAGSPATAARWDNFTVTQANTLAYDSFNRADSATTLGKNELGQSWSPVTGTWGTIGSEAYSVTDASNDQVVLPALGVTDYEISCLMKGATADGTNYRLPNLMVKYVDVNNFIRLRFDPIGTGQGVVLGKIDAGSGTDLAIDTSMTLVDGRYYAIRVQCQGAVIKVWVDGVLKLNYNLTSAEYTKYGAASTVGFRLSKGGTGGTSSVRWDNFAVKKTSSLLARDSFDRANNTTAVGTSDSGQIWQSVTGTWGISGNALYCASDVQGDKVILPNVGTGDYIVKSSLLGSYTDGSNWSEPCLIVRYVDSNNYMRINPDWHVLTLSKVVGGTSTALFTLGAQAYPDNTYFECKVACIGPNIKVYIDGVLKIDYTMTPTDYAQFGTAGGVGARLLRGGTPLYPGRWDNFRVYTPDVLISDSFSRSDSTTTLGKAETGDTWTAVNGTWGVLSGEGYSVSDAHNDQAVLPILPYSNYTVSTNAKGSITGTSIRRFSIMFNWLDSDNFMQFYLEDGGLWIEKFSNGSVVDLAEKDYPTTDSAYYNLKVSYIGGVVYGYVNNVLCLKYALTTHELSKYGDARRVGIRLRKAGTPSPVGRFDDFTVSPADPLAIDSFNRYDNANSLGATDTGQFWTPLFGTWGISANEAYCPSDGHGHMITVPTTSPDFTISYDGKGTVNSSVNNSQPSCMVKVIDGNNFFTVETYANWLTLSLWDNGATWTDVIGVAITTTDNVYANIKVTCSGRNMTVWYNSVLAGTYTMTDSQYAKYGSSQTAGLRLSKKGTPATAARWNNLIITPEAPLPKVSDSFERADSTTTLSKTDTGQTWSSLGTSTWGISGNEAYSVSNADGDIVRIPSIGTGNYLVSVRIKGDLGTNYSLPGILWRGIDGQNWWRTRFETDGSIVTGKLDNDSFFGYSVTATGLVVSNTYYTLGVRCIGSVVQILLNGAVKDTFLMPAADQAKFGNAGIVGLRLSANGTATTPARFDNFTVSALPSFSPTVLAYDAFVRSDSRVGANQADTGQLWDQYSGQWGIIGNELYNVSDSNNSMIGIDVNVSDYVISARIRGHYTGAIRSAAIAFGIVDDVSMLHAELEAGALNLYKRDGTNGSQVIATVSTTTTDGTYYNLKVKKVGSAISLYKDGVNLLNYTLSGAEATTYGSRTSVGVRLGTSAGTVTSLPRWDNFTVTTADTAFYDSFNRSDSASLGVADTGQTWTLLEGTAMGVTGSQAYSPSGETVAYIDAGTANVDISTSFSVKSTSQGIYFRITDIPNNWFFEYSGTTSTYRLMKHVANASILVYDTGITPADGDTLRVVASGSSIGIYVNSVLRQTVTDSFNSTATKHGFDTGEQAAGRVDNFSIRALASSVVTTLPSVNIGGVWKVPTGGYVNIGGTWKPITESWVNIGGTWKKL